MEDNRRGINRVTREVNIEATQSLTVLPKQFVSNIIAGATTPSVKNIEKLKANNVAPITITDFLEGQEGQTLWILGDGQTSVAHDPTKIYTRTLAAILLVANLLYVFQLRDGVWHMTA